MSIVNIVSNAMQYLAKQYEQEYSIVPLYTMNAPGTGKAIHAAWLQAQVSGYFPVYSDTSNGCIFGNECNLAYRFVHDIDHALAYEKGQGTTNLADEKRLNAKLCNRIYSIVIEKHGENVALQAFFLLYADTVGQSLNYAKTGNFVADQIAFTANLVLECKGYKLACSGHTGLAQQYKLAYLLECNAL
jgi:hypothetical protein